MYGQMERRPCQLDNCLVRISLARNAQARHLFYRVALTAAQCGLGAGAEALLMRCCVHEPGYLAEMSLP